MSASIDCVFCQAGGRTILIALNKFMPPLTRSSSILSSDEESDPVSLTNCLNFWIFGISGEINLDNLAFTQYLLHLILSMDLTYIHKVELDNLHNL